MNYRQSGRAVPAVLHGIDSLVRPLAIFLVIALAAGLAACSPASGTGENNDGGDAVQAQDQNTAGEPVTDPAGAPVGTRPAPAFPEGLDWINTPGPLTIEDLRGKIVLLDFWTYGCINCIHMFPVLEQLEEKYSDELVVIGVHSAKFENEGQTENIRQIVQRYDLHHPVINDSDFLVWNSFNVRAWPSFALIDPRGNIYAIDAGEIPFTAFDRVIGEMVDYFDGTGELDRAPLDLDLAGVGSPATPLRYPGKILADAENRRLFIADTNHHRIVVADLDTFEVLDVIGSGQRGFADGTYEEAAFNKPQGMARDGDILYVADTNNHAVRAVDLDAGTVTTIAGVGSRDDFSPNLDLPADQVVLRSPWDVELDGAGTLYIAMAGTHQIWALDLAADRLRAAVGDGREALKNASLLDSELAQPSGLYYQDGLLYFADAESSTIRVADFNRDEVRTVSGHLVNNLFEFGDVDGRVGESRLQHALGVVGGADGLIYIADTYNSKIKVLDPETDETTTLFGLGEGGGFRDGGPQEAAFDEPGGLDYADGKLYVADTNNHAVRIIDLAEGRVSTLTFVNPEALQMAEQPVMVVGGGSVVADVTLPGQTIAAGEGEIVLSLTLPEGYKVNDLIDSTAAFSTTDGRVTFAGDATSVIDSVELRIPVTLAEGEDTLTADLAVYYCRVGEEALCLIEMVVIEVPLTIQSGGGDAAIQIDYTIVPPEL